MKIALLGYGKMGKTIDQLITERFADKHEVVLRIDASNANMFTVESLADVDVAIEFSTPQTVPINIERCFAASVPIVVGTTAWYAYFEAIKAACETQKQALFYATNFSIGVNIFFSMNQQLAKMMNGQGYEVQIDEIHHTTKLDAPSGTAITLAQDLIQTLDTKHNWVNQETMEANQLGIVSHRLEEVKGTHQITYTSPVDTIEIKHTAHSRTGFALGAILAAQWIVGKKGVFTMKDMLGGESN